MENFLNSPYLSISLIIIIFTFGYFLYYYISITAVLDQQIKGLSRIVQNLKTENVQMQTLYNNNNNNDNNNDDKNSENEAIMTFELPDLNQREFSNHIQHNIYQNMLSTLTGIPQERHVFSSNLENVISDLNDTISEEDSFPSITEIQQCQHVFKTGKRKGETCKELVKENGSCSKHTN